MNYIDTETFSATPIKHGTYRYTSSCEVMVVTYAFGADDPVQTWDRASGEPMPADLRWILDDPDELLTAHSSMFDRNALRYDLKIDVPVPRWRDTMVKALAHGLPGGLDILCQILNVPIDKAKNKDGKKLIQLFCKPQRDGSRATPFTHPAEWDRFLDYARSDVTAMREIDRKLPVWNYRDSELALWFLDQKINDRGMCVDVGFARAAITAVDRAQDKLRARTHEATDGDVGSTTQRDQLLAHIVRSYGVELPNLQKDTLERRMTDPELPAGLRELLAIRLQQSSSSTSKYRALVNGVQADGRLRGTSQFNGAARTRRWAHRQFQPGNMPRPDMEPRDIDFGIEAIMVGAEDLLFDDVMRVTRNAVRGCIIAPPGKKLVIVDLANIEGRDGAWCGGEDWKLQAFRDYDAGVGPDLYKLAYSKSFNIPHQEVTKPQRQIGKVEELFMQYEGGVGAFITGAATYGIDLDEMTNSVWDTLPGDVIGEAHGMWEWTLDMKRPTFGLSERVFCACDSIKRLWRRRHLRLSAIWKELKDAAALAINNPGETVECRMFKLRRSGAWLRILLPSGNYLCYSSPQVSEHGDLSYMGMNQYTRKWSRIGTYGGKLFENICQSLAGDVLKSSMPAMEDAGYEIVLTVHDEAVTEAPDTKDFSHEALAAIMSKGAPWTKGLPLAAAGFETYRYRKE